MDTDIWSVPEFVSTKMDMNMDTNMDMYMYTDMGTNMDIEMDTDIWRVTEFLSTKTEQFWKKTLIYNITLIPPPLKRICVWNNLLHSGGQGGEDRPDFADETCASYINDILGPF
jgi:hypothetical protein